MSRSRLTLEPRRDLLGPKNFSLDLEIEVEGQKKPSSIQSLANTQHLALCIENEGPAIIESPTHIFNLINQTGLNLRHNESKTLKD